MSDTAGEPRMEDFGITEQDLERTPCVFLTRHRAGVLTSVYLLLGAAVFLVIAAAGHSVAAAALFAVIALAAGSVLLLPALVFLLCASEQAEERWLCSRFPKMRACLAYRRAVAEHARSEQSVRDMPPETWWASAPPGAFAAAVQRALERGRRGGVSAVSREATGADLEVRTGSGKVLVRSEAGTGPVAAGVGRELSAAVGDRGAELALIVTVAEPTPELEAYLKGRPIAIVSPLHLDGELSRLGS